MYTPGNHAANESNIRNMVAARPRFSKITADWPATQGLMMVGMTKIKTNEGHYGWLIVVIIVG